MGSPMKNLWNLKAILVTGGVVVCGGASADPVVHHVSLKVTLDNGSDYKKIKGSVDRTRTEKCQLKIALDNRDNVQIKNLSVKWTLYGRTMGKDNLVTVGNGVRKVTVDALTSLDFTSDSVSFNGTPKHAITTTTRNQNTKTANTKTTEVAATGNAYYGYAVQVYDGQVLLDQAFSQNALKVDH